MNLEFREILNVQITVVQSAGQPVRVVDVLDKSPLGPLVQARLVDGTADDRADRRRPQGLLREETLMAFAPFPPRPT